MKNTITNRGLELIELVKYYKELGDERYFEELWSRVKPFAFKMGHKYKGMISIEEMEQTALICLFDCCRYIKEDCNVLTYYGKILLNRYYDITHPYRKKPGEKINREAFSLDATYEDDSSNYVLNASMEDDIFIIEDFYKHCKLVRDEIAMAELLNMGYKKKDIIEKLEIEAKDYKRIRKNLLGKVKSNYDFETI